MKRKFKRKILEKLDYLIEETKIVIKEIGNISGKSLPFWENKLKNYLEIKEMFQKL